MQWIKRAWLGEERLWKVFWLYSFASGIVLEIATIFGFVMLLPHVQLLPWRAPIWVYVLFGVWVIFLCCFAVWATVGLWKCSFNTSRRFWGYAARVAFLLSATFSVADFAGYSGNAGENSNSAGGWNWEIDCEKLMHTYATKHGLDPQKYVNDNQSYMHDCVQWPHFYEPTLISDVNQESK